MSDFIRLHENEYGEIDGIHLEDADELSEKVSFAKTLWQRALNDTNLVNEQKKELFRELVGDTDAFSSIASTFMIVADVLNSQIFQIANHRESEDSTFETQFMQLLHSFFEATCWHLNYDYQEAVMRSPLGIVCGKRKYEEGDRRFMKITADDLLEFLEFCENAGLQTSFEPSAYGIGDEDSDEDYNDNPAERAGELRAPLHDDDDEPDSGMDDPFEEDADYDDEE